ncbi:hypothetical protein AVEN_128456-1 [Araneus ventricosus]|uniref:Uncharacterized protein n=1 Tax=Araneus ventricosus TaxID=182803 RepID=A0A4Y2MZU3_ARAVE|nr:hypothetical protein AVEN_128456-1 [Araneus ventricosus]
MLKSFLLKRRITLRSLHLHVNYQVIVYMSQVSLTPSWKSSSKMIRVPAVNEGCLWKSCVAEPCCVLLQVVAQESFFAALFCRIRLAPSYYKVTVEARRRKGPPGQFFKCQHYFHNSRSCLRDPVCVGRTKVYGTSLAKLAPNHRKLTKRSPCCHIYHAIVRYWVTTFGDLSPKKIQIWRRTAHFLLGLCVKCAGPHDSRGCPKPRETPAKCVTVVMNTWQIIRVAHKTPFNSRNQQKKPI